MIPHSQPEREQMIRRMISKVMDDIDAENDMHLTKWEVDFIRSVNSQFVRKLNLSDSQCDILERIYDK